MNAYVTRVIDDLKARFPWETEFLQAATEILESLSPLMDKEPKYEKYKILERIVEPERSVSFRVPWIDDKGEYQVNRGYRVQFNSAIGPYKGGIRFHKAVTLSMMKFLGFEQIFKNSLTSLPMGGGKGGSDFDPNGKSDNEIMRFCQSYITELYRYIGADVDVPAGDVGVGAREIGYMYGQYKRIKNEFTGVFTGKGREWGGSVIRPEATGFGAIYFAEQMLKEKGETLEGKTIAVSGFGNVTWGTVMKATQKGAKVVTLSGPDGYIYDKDGVGTKEKWDHMLVMRASGRNKVKDYSDKFGVPFYEGKKPWTDVKCDIAMTCAFQNELNKDDARRLIDNGCKYLIEVSNMGCQEEAWKLARKEIVYAPGKAVNAGGVAVSGLEMSQNSERLHWKAEEVDSQLQNIMFNIHKACVDAAEQYSEMGRHDYVTGANIAGFKKVAEAMIAQGLV